MNKFTKPLLVLGAIAVLPSVARKSATFFGTYKQKREAAKRAKIQENIAIQTAKLSLELDSCLEKLRANGSPNPNGSDFRLIELTNDVNALHRRVMQNAKSG